MPTLNLGSLKAVKAQSGIFCGVVSRKSVIKEILGNTVYLQNIIVTLCRSNNRIIILIIIMIILNI